MTQEWIDKQEEWCLVNYQTIKSDLTSFLEQVTHSFGLLSLSDRGQSPKFRIIFAINNYWTARDFTTWISTVWLHC